ncbi:hypothetical protein PAI11_40070 [Patulibacter medicamentivorans]|uniref:Uncharacterized protein n=1 Tax=Patulibacter medicamentivorans TaxID=1097667 RepID=H0EAY2_9ACTN|nr:hypothetical protein PAI11_40070 [Patulibacter medicamentivorans]
MARHRQLPTRVGRLHPRYGTPWMVIGATAAIAAGLVAGDAVASASLVVGSLRERTPVL